jgi:hypothetical protein
MTRKDYVALAKALRGERPHRIRWEIAWKQWAVDVGAVADVLAADNPRFDIHRFIQACHEGEEGNT